MSGGRIAILIDGGFFLRRLPKLVAARHCNSPGRIVACIRHLCRNHIKALTGDDDSRWHKHVYRIFYYDAVPYDGKAHHPIDNRPIDFAKSDLAQQRYELFDLLRKQRKVALRLGKVNREHDWAIRPELTKRLLKSRGLLDALTALPEEGGEADHQLTLTPQQVADLRKLRELWSSLDGRSIRLGLRQKGVDMRIGIDIASLALKRQVDTVILVAGDSDFVPAAKLARREGMEFILDPLWQQVNPDLFEHIDGLQSGLKRPQNKP
ncbi:MAG: NYN domain-containing protein [Gammaproteobacteria bacterium]